MTDETGTEKRRSSVCDLVGQTLGDYRILRRLGRGAMAEVFLAEQLSLSRRIAFKVLLPDLAADASYVRRFRHEATAAATLVHANIVQIYEVGQLAGVHFIAQEYVPGRNLGEVVQRSGPLDGPMVAVVLRQVAAALVKADEHGIVHRDIKPENLLLSRSGEVKVADFGLARITGAEGVDLTQVGVAMGTPLYMSPEQIQGNTLDTRSDIYSLGATAYHLLAGEPPFLGDTSLAVAVQHLNAMPERLEDRRSKLPEGVARMVHKMLAKKPKNRYANGRELLADLRAAGAAGDAEWAAAAGEWSTSELIALADQSSDATTRLGELMKTSALLQPRRRSRRWFAAAILACLALGALAAPFLSSKTLLSSTATENATPRANAKAELFHAKRVGTEAAWKNVELLHPGAGNAYYHRVAAVGLLRYYLVERFESANIPKAIEVSQRLAEDRDVEPQFQAAGLAGLFIAHALSGEPDKAESVYDRLMADDNLATALARYPTLVARLTELDDRLRADAERRFEQLRGDAEPAS